jgi:eukaryotic-like serine/threonine-protein kinase
LAADFSKRESMATLTTTTPAPPIPDHEVLRVIGRGAYGEIWLARSLTGTLRAVKVVYRSTFENERAFNREFAGMSSFEPISRAHDGFVDILHVGRNDAAGFFYYVMELADDQRTGEPIDPAADPQRVIEHYAPKTLAADLTVRGHLPAAESVQLGLSMSAALRALHEHGLSHRDVKPSNIIFVHGVPKLADIGLVATSGQRSFVGTEGYVPPEGPGTAQADIYSLGKVLYEISMGKDRLDFPEVSTKLDERPDKAELLKLNEVLLKACATDLAKRYRTADEMRADLARLERGRPVRRKRGWFSIALILLVLFGAAALAWNYRRTHAGLDAAEARGKVAITTEPPGAKLILGDRGKDSPATFDDIEPGKYALHIMLAGFEPVDAKVEVAPNRTLNLPPFKLQRAKGSLQISTQPEGAEFELRAAGGAVAGLYEAGSNGAGAPQQARGPNPSGVADPGYSQRGVTPAMLRDVPTGVYQLNVKRGDWELHDNVEINRGEVTIKTLEFASGKIAVTSEPAGAEIFVDGKSRGKSPLELDLPAGAHQFAAKFDGWPEQRQSATVEKNVVAPVAFDFGNGSVKIASAPGGATVLQGGKELGATPLLIEEVKPGEAAYELRLAGYKNASVKGMVEPKQQTLLLARLEKRLSPEPGQPWENSLGMKFVPVGGASAGSAQAVRFCVWPTRVKDWEAFCKVTGRTIEKPDFAQDENHPVVKVSWYDATDFCKWLTEKERRENFLDEGQSYRLPTDKEWSMAVGLPDEGGATPEQRDGKIKNEFPWGRQWPPPAGAGNYADQSARRQRGQIIEGYNDGFPTTAPVGSFKPNSAGLHDMGGNVWQWCVEDYKGGGKFKDWGVLRGGSWGTSNRNELLSSYRNVVDRNDRDVIYGFRCVLVAEPAQ